MLKLLGSIILILFISCNGKRKLPVTSIKESYFDTSLNNALLKYQVLFPIPNKNPDKNAKYVYVVFFYKANGDTFVDIIRSAQGYRVLEDEKVYGIYKNDSLEPTVIRDSKEFYSKMFLKKIIADSQSLNSFRTINGKDYPESFPPLFEFQIKKNMLSLQRIDTAWLKWD